MAEVHLSVKVGEVLNHFFSLYFVTFCKTDESVIKDSKSHSIFSFVRMKRSRPTMAKKTEDADEADQGLLTASDPVADKKRRQAGIGSTQSDEPSTQDFASQYPNNEDHTSTSGVANNSSTEHKSDPNVTNNSTHPTKDQDLAQGEASHIQPGNSNSESPLPPSPNPQSATSPDFVCPSLFCFKLNSWLCKI
jgi:hypothetical protein